MRPSWPRMHACRSSEALFANFVSDPTTAPRFRTTNASERSDAMPRHCPLDGDTRRPHSLSHRRDPRGWSRASPPLDIHQTFTSQVTDTRAVPGPAATDRAPSRAPRDTGTARPGHAARGPDTGHANAPRRRRTGHRYAPAPPDRAGAHRAPWRTAPDRPHAHRTGPTARATVHTNHASNE